MSSALNVTRADSTTTTIEASTLAEWPLTELDRTPDQENSTDRIGSIARVQRARLNDRDASAVNLRASEPNAPYVAIADT